MEKVRVYNDNKFTHTEKFMGDEIRIAPGEYLEMIRDEAVMFKSQFYPPKFGGDGVQLAESYKMIRIAEIDGSEKPKPKREEHRCHVCREVFKSNAGLMSHIRHNHADSMIDEDARKELLAKEA